MKLIVNIEVDTCTDKEWVGNYSHTFTVDGYDGNGWITVQLPVTREELRELRENINTFCKVNEI